MPILPQQCEQFGYIIVILAVIALSTARRGVGAEGPQELVAYSSVNHMGYVMLGSARRCVGSALKDNGDLAKLATMAVNGAFLQMICHGLSRRAVLPGRHRLRATHTRMIAITVAS